jgi:RimJ/RimL family protein N-acetyltransferase
MNSPEKISLRDVQESDLAVFFEYQSDPEANHMAAFTAKDPTDKDAFMAHWARILNDETTTNKTILLGREVVGHIASFIQFGEREVSYWLGRQYWGRGLATQALTKFLADFTVRPLYGRAAKDNVASIRVLEKCGFTICGEDKGFANARGEEVEEYILKLEAANSQ